MVYSLVLQAGGRTNGSEVLKWKCNVEVVGKTCRCSEQMLIV